MTQNVYEPSTHNVYELSRNRPVRRRPEEPLPTFTWEQLERQLVELSAPGRAALATALVRTVRLQSPAKAPEMLLREILCLAWTLLEEEGFDAPGGGVWPD